MQLKVNLVSSHSLEVAAISPSVLPVCLSHSALRALVFKLSLQESLLKNVNFKLF